MDLINFGEKLLQTVRSRRSLSILSGSSFSDRPEVPARAAAAAAVARSLAALPPHERLTLPTTSGGSPSVYGNTSHRQEIEDLDEDFFEQEFDPVRHLLEQLPKEDFDQKFLDVKIGQRFLQLDAITERLSRQVMEHHEEMVEGMQLVTELEKDLQVTNIICKNGRRHLASAMHEVSQDLVVTANVKKKQILLDMLPYLERIQQAVDIKSRLDVIVDEGNYGRALHMCSECLQVLDECVELSAIQDMNHNIEEWLQKTIEKVDGVLLDVCRKFDAKRYLTVIDAYAMIDDVASLIEKIQNCFAQIVVSETHAVLNSHLCEGEDPQLTKKKTRLPYNDLCLQLPESKFKSCLYNMLEVLYDILCSYYAMMTWKHSFQSPGSSASSDVLSNLSLNGKHQRSRSHGSLTITRNEPPTSYTVSRFSLEVSSAKSNSSAHQVTLNSGLANQRNSGTSLEQSLFEGRLYRQNGAEMGSNVRGQVPEGGELRQGNSENGDTGFLPDGLASQLRADTIANVGRALEKGRKTLWELAARRVSALLSSDEISKSSTQHFLQSLDCMNKFILAGEAFCGAEAISLRAKLIKQSDKYFGSFHRQNLEVVRLMLEKETWKELPGDALKMLNIVGLTGNGAPIFGGSSGIVNPKSITKSITSGSLLDTFQSATGRSGEKGMQQTGFLQWLERGNPFSERRTHNSASKAGVEKSLDDKLERATWDAQPVPELHGSNLVKENNSSGTLSNENSRDPEEDENEDLLADFIDEDSQQPSRLYSSVRSELSASGSINKQLSGYDDLLTLTGSSIAVLRSMDRYARLMQILQTISLEVFKGFCQLFELYFFTVFKIFGHREAFSSAKGQFDGSPLLTARLRATLVRVSQQLEEQRAKLPSAENAPTSLTTTASSIVSDVSSLVSGQTFIASTNLTSHNLSIKDHTIAIESLLSLVQILKRSQSHLQAILPQNAWTFLEQFYLRTVDAVPDLKEHVYKTLARLLLNIGGYVDRVANAKWELKDLGMEHNGYIDLLLGEYKQYTNKLGHAGISKEVQDLLMEYGVDTIAEVLVEGLSRVKRCNNEGRALMSLDLQVLINGLQHLAPARMRTNLQIVEVYIKAFYLPETEYLHWIRAHPEYAKPQLIGLINLVASTNNWKRKTRLELMEKIENGDL
ncbi:hypothetical protein O6H91_03G024200 [Diphasiastrum complanatum]|uniref:Uncharacterized protein n=1 Tax=Diphasiastrum complanatum TaxID=34168 RepID=A0ACC2E519_DIPCM|nr:hypothetical protein O6H91_03G024200 [Diphasiastrum complanatum]